MIILSYTFQDKVPVGIWDDDCMNDFSDILEEIAYTYDLR